MRITSGFVAAGLLVAAAAVEPARATAQDGYLFKPPMVTLSLRGGAAVPAANDEIHQFFTRELTLDRSDFRSASFGGDVALWVNPQLDLVVSVFHASISKQSESRHWLDENDETIDQTTELSRTPVTVGARYFIKERGRSVGNFAWVPTSMSPYVGAAAGITWYNLTQDGWFVAENLDIFRDNFQASGNTPTLQLLGGAEWWLAPRFGLNVEGRYSWAKASLRNSYSFSDFQSIDLRGFQLAAGISTRF